MAASKVLGLFYNISIKKYYVSVLRMLAIGGTSFKTYKVGFHDPSASRLRRLVRGRKFDERKGKRIYRFYERE